MSVEIMLVVTTAINNKPASNHAESTLIKTIKVHDYKAKNNVEIVICYMHSILIASTLYTGLFCSGNGGNTVTAPPALYVLARDDVCCRVY